VLLLRAGARLEATDCNGFTALYQCCVVGDAALPMARLLLRAGADPDAPNHISQADPWHCMDAAMFNHTSVQLGLLRELLGAEASVAPRGVQTDTALPAWRTRVSYLCTPTSRVGGYEEAMGLLLAAGACPSAVALPALMGGDNSLPPPLLAAVCYGASPACLRSLLAAGAHPDAPCVAAAGGARESVPRVALQQALEAEGGGSAPAVAALLQAGASTAGQSLCWPSRHCSEKVLRLLLGAGVSVHASGACKTALLTHALHRGDTGREGLRWRWGQAA
jgi:hypothetical protein